ERSLVLLGAGVVFGRHARRGMVESGLGDGYEVVAQVEQGAQRRSAQPQLHIGQRLQIGSKVDEDQVRTASDQSGGHAPPRAVLRRRREEGVDLLERWAHAWVSTPHCAPVYAENLVKGVPTFHRGR